MAESLTASASAAVPVGPFDVYRYTMSVPPKKVPQPRNRQSSDFVRKPYFRALSIVGIFCSTLRDSRPHLMCG